MCTVSMISGWGQDHWPNPQRPNKTAPQQQQPPTPTQDQWHLFKEILDKLGALDQKLGLKDCQDEQKAKWFKEMDERMKALESKRTSD